MTKGMDRPFVNAGRLAALACGALALQGAAPPVAAVAAFLAAGIGLTSFVVWGRAAFPKTAGAADKVVEGSSPWKTFWVGLIMAVAAFLLVALLLKAAQAAKPLGLLALLAALFAGGVAFRGALGIWPSYGRLILGPDSPASPLQETLSGGALLTAAVLLFPVGILFFLYALARSMGAGVLLHVEKPAQPAVEQGAR